MKKLLSVLCFLLPVFMVACKKNDDGKSGPAVNTYDGKYKGNSYYDNQPIGQWEMTIKDGKIAGNYIQMGEVSAITGTVTESGKMNVKIDNADGTYTNVNATIQNNMVSGTWSNSEGLSGTISGEKEADPGGSFLHDGVYSGTATLNGTPSADWEMSVIKGQVSGLFHDQTGTAFMVGHMSQNGDALIDIVYDNGAKIKADLKVSGNNISGTWSGDGNSGAMNGGKESGNATNSYDGQYEGQAFMGGDAIGSWTLIVDNNLATGSYSGDGESGTIKGMVAPDGAIYFNAYIEDDFAVNVKAKISGTSVTGTWSNTDGESGTLSGTKK